MAEGGREVYFVKYRSVNSTDFGFFTTGPRLIRTCGLRTKYTLRPPINKVWVLLDRLFGCFFG